MGLPERARPQTKSGARIAMPSSARPNCRVSRSPIRRQRRGRRATNPPNQSTQGSTRTRSKRSSEGLLDIVGMATSPEAEEKLEEQRTGQQEIGRAHV